MRIAGEAQAELIKIAAIGAGLLAVAYMASKGISAAKDGIVDVFDDVREEANASLDAVIEPVTEIKHISEAPIAPGSPIPQAAAGSPAGIIGVLWSAPEVLANAIREWWDKP